MQLLLDGILYSFESFDLKLYQNNYTPVDGSSGANFTESTFPGYANWGLARGDFAAPVLVGAQASANDATVPEFVCTGGAGEDAYGWYLLSHTTVKVLAAQRFTTKFTMVSGAKIKLDPATFLLQALH